MKKEEKKTRTQILREKAKAKALRFKRELRKSTVTAITAAFGFLIALAWRDVIKEFVNKISESSPLQGQLVSAILITVVSVLGIVFVSEFALKKEEKEIKKEK
jgi:hypothetical protein